MLRREVLKSFMDGNLDIDFEDDENNWEMIFKKILFHLLCSS